jgi:hypothetical protein
VKRHRYKTSSGRNGTCTCGQGRSEEIHRLLVWHRATTGNWVSEIADDNAVYRCRHSADLYWWPEVLVFGELEGWSALGNGEFTLVAAKAACEAAR